MNQFIKRQLTLCIVTLFASLSCFSQVIKSVARQSAPPALAAITEKELRDDLFEMAGDHFRGREAGTLDELKASVWWADKARRAGLKPMGDDGTYFQFFNLKRRRISNASTLQLGTQQLALWKDVLVTQTTPVNLSLPVVYGGRGSKQELDKLDLKGRAVAISVSSQGINLAVSLPERRYLGYVLRKYGADLASRGASAIVFVADTMAEKSWSQVVPALSRGTYDIEGSVATAVTTSPVFWVHAALLPALTGQGATIRANVEVESFDYPSVNIVAALDGTDPALKEEFVLYSGHTDHDGVRQPYGNDSIYNGADDNATVNVAMMAIARALRKAPGKRSALFVWHGAEERGLLGSRWYAAHPTVPKSSIIAVLNGDMIGYNNPDSAALLGMQPPHRNSADLVAAALRANAAGPRFKLDTLWDKPNRVEGWYFRSDHLSYARLGYPAIFYTTLLHPLYHTPMDAPGIIDIKKLKRMTEWMYRTGWELANAANKPALEQGFKLER